MQELLVDFITSLDGYAAAEGGAGWWGLQGPEYLAWLGEQPERDHREHRLRPDLRRLSHVTLDVVTSRTFDGRLQLLEYVPTVLTKHWTCLIGVSWKLGIVVDLFAFTRTIGSAQSAVPAP